MMIPANHQDRFSPDSLPMSNWPADVRPFEPVYGWMQRAAGENYAHSVESFIWGLGINGRDWNFEEQLEIARQLPLTGLPELEWFTPTQTSEGIEVCGQRLASRFFAKSERRICPECIEESRHLRVWFDIAPLAVCPLHNTLLISGLPDDPIDWRNPACGWTQSGVKISGMHASGAEASSLDKYIVDTLSGATAGSPVHLAAEPMNAVIHAAVCIGKLSVGWDNFGESHKDLRELSQRGFAPLAEGADAIVEFLSRSAWLNSDFRDESQSSRLRHASKVIRAVPSTSLRSIIADCFGAVRIRNRLSTPAGRYARLGDQAGYWNLESAAEILGIQSRFLGRILDELKIVPSHDRQGHAFRLSAKQINVVRAYMEDCLSTSDTAKSLGCATADVDEFVQRKLLTVKFRAGGERYFSKVETQEIVDSAIKKRGSLPRERGIPLELFAKAENVSLATAHVQLVRDKTLELTHIEDGSPFFQAAHVAINETAERNSSFRIRPQAQVRDAITFANAAARLGTGSNGLKQLVDLGFIHIEASGSGERRVSEGSLNDFASRYVRAAAYASLLECNPLSAIKFLRKHGVVPINEGRRHNVKFVERAEVERLTGFKLSNDTVFEEWNELAQRFKDTSAKKGLPATVRVLATPGITIRATTGRWAFLVTHGDEEDSYRLITNFRATKEPARFRKIKQTGINPNSIWPEAELTHQASGGFVLHDHLTSPRRAEVSHSAIIDRLVDRAFQLHRLIR